MQHFSLSNTGNVQGVGANQIAALSTDGVLFPKSIRNMSEISEVSEVSNFVRSSSIVFIEYC